VDVKARLFRNYPLGETGSHLLGYIGRINQAEKAAMEDWDDEDLANYRGTEYIGKLGLEQSYERRAARPTGFEEVETSAGGRAVRRLSQPAGHAGQHPGAVHRHQAAGLVEQLFGDRRGALVAIDPRNGEVLAFVSKPTFDPNLFVDGIDGELARAERDIDKPLLNRALRGTYPPGSTYKPFMAMAALNSGKRAASTIIMDNLVYTSAAATSAARRPTGPAHGHAPRHRQSSNVYFYSLANEMGVDLIHEQLEPLGFGRKTGIDLEGEVTGDLPSTEWKRKRFKQARAAEVVCRRDHLAGHRPGLQQLHHAADGQRHGHAGLGRAALRAAPGARDRGRGHPQRQRLVPMTRSTPLPLKPEHVAVIRDAMHGVPTQGTSAGPSPARATQRRQDRHRAGGGRDRNEKYNASRVEEHKRDHSLYIAFAPLERPTVALAVIVENAGWGSAARPRPSRGGCSTTCCWASTRARKTWRWPRVKARASPMGTPRRAGECPCQRRRCSGGRHRRRLPAGRRWRCPAAAAPAGRRGCSHEPSSRRPSLWQRLKPVFSGFDGPLLLVLLLAGSAWSPCTRPATTMAPASSTTAATCCWRWPSCSWWRR
jgi:penicillin-binding protein 2